MTSPIWRVRLMVGHRAMNPEMNGSNPLPATMGGCPLISSERKRIV